MTQKISQIVKTLRAERELSQTDLSRLSGLSQSAIAQIETGARSSPTLRTLLALAKAFGVDLEIFLEKPGKST